MFTKNNKWYWDFVLTNETGRVLTKDLLLVFIEMKKLSKQLDEFRRQTRKGKLNPQDSRTRLALWSGYIVNEGVDLMAEAQTIDPVFQQVMDAERDYWGDSRNRFLQMLEERAERDRYSEVQAATRNAFDKGEAKGRAEGAHLNALKTARLMLARKMEIDFIMEATGLPENEIRELDGKM
jgi:hypothetical protein